MSNVYKVKLLPERTSGVPLIILSSSKNQSFQKTCSGPNEKTGLKRKKLYLGTQDSHLMRFLFGPESIFLKRLEPRCDEMDPYEMQ